MNVREEIELYAHNLDKDILYWLLRKYNWARHPESPWQLVAKCRHEAVYKEGVSFERKVWKPTQEGYILYLHRDVLGDDRNVLDKN